MMKTKLANQGRKISTRSKGLLSVGEECSYIWSWQRCERRRPASGLKRELRRQGEIDKIGHGSAIRIRKKWENGNPLKANAAQQVDLARQRSHEHCESGYEKVDLFLLHSQCNVCFNRILDGSTVY
jgi:hypothetical protein